MTESRYLQVFGDATDAVLRLVGVDSGYLAAGHSYYTVETHLRHLREVAGGETISVHTQVLGCDDKRLHLFHRLMQDDSGAELATAEHLLLHVDTRAHRRPRQAHRCWRGCTRSPRRSAARSTGCRRQAYRHAGARLTRPPGRSIIRSVSWNSD